MYFFLAPPELDETGGPRSFPEDELLQFLRVCYSVILLKCLLSENLGSSSNNKFIIRR
jgi:hypothetical protein